MVYDKLNSLQRLLATCSYIFYIFVLQSSLLQMTEQELQKQYDAIRAAAQVLLLDLTNFGMGVVTLDTCTKDNEQLNEEYESGATKKTRDSG